MRGCLNIIAIVFGLCLLGIGYLAFYPRATQTKQVHYRVTVTVKTPTGERRGSGVWGYSEAANQAFTGGGYRWVFSPLMEGEAIPVDLGNGRTIYALLGKGGAKAKSGSRIPATFVPSFYFLNALGQGDVSPAGQDRKDADARIAFLQARLGRPVALDCTPGGNSLGQCPALIVADGPAARNIELLDPDNLPATLGPGYWLRGITIEVVGDPITRGIAKRLPWVKAPDPGQFGRDLGSVDAEIRATGFIRKDMPR